MREVCELILKAQGYWEKLLRKYELLWGGVHSAPASAWLWGQAA